MANHKQATQVAPLTYDMHPSKPQKREFMAAFDKAKVLITCRRLRAS